MKMKYNMMTLAAILMAAACSDEEYGMGPEPSADNVGAFFASSNTANHILTPEEFAAKREFSVEVRRTDTEEAVTVPVIVDYKDDAITVSPEVVFPKGSSTSTIVLSASADLEVGHTASFSVHLADDYVNPYAKNDGTPQFSGSILVARWMKIVEDAYFYDYSKTGVIPTGTSDIYILEGNNRFYMDNFLGMGIKLGFSINNSSFKYADRETWKGGMVVSDHVYKEVGDGYTYIYPQDDNGNYLSWTANGKTVSYLCMSESYDYGSYVETPPIDLRAKEGASYSGYWQCYALYEDGSYSSWTYLYLTWDESNIVNIEQ